MKNNDDEIVEACKSSFSMAEAASKVGIHFNTFRRKAIKLGVYSPNQSGKGISKPNSTKIPLQEILEGKHPYYQTNKLRKRLIKEGIKKEECEECHITDWNNKRVAFELEHMDGDRTNHKLENLKILCPNCHSQTETYRGKNTK
jgi:5-methylcytosine-specific restriction endonuclease McrA